MKILKNIYFALGTPAFFIHEGFHLIFAVLVGANISEIEFGFWKKYRKEFHYYYLTFNVGFSEKNTMAYFKCLLVAIAPVFAYLTVFFEPYLIFYFLIYHKRFWLSKMDIFTITKSYKEIQKRL